MKKTFRFNKLIRTNLHKSMVNHGIELKLKELIGIESMINSLKEKLTEEAAEVVDAQNNEDMIEELADCLEVIRGFANVLDVSFEDIEEARKKKAKERGGFEKLIFVENVTLSQEGDLKPFYDYYISNPKKYPIIK